MHAQVLCTIDGVAATDNRLHADRRNFYEVEKRRREVKGADMKIIFAAADRFVCAFPSAFPETAQAFHTSALALIDAGTV